jgi:hypothetical protein
MAAFFIDLDDTIVEHGTNRLLPGAMDMLEAIKAKGHQIFFTTRRGDDWDDRHVYGRKSTQAFLDALGIKYDSIVFNVESPRVVLNDGGGIGVTHPAGAPLNYKIGHDPEPILIVKNA